MDLRFTIYDLRSITSVEERTTSAMPVWFGPRASSFPSPRPSPLGRGRMPHCRSAKLIDVSGRRTSRIIEPGADCPLSPWERVRVRGIGLPLNTATLTFPGTVELCDSSGKAGGFV